PSPRRRRPSAPERTPPTRCRRSRSGRCASALSGEPGDQPALLRAEPRRVTRGGVLTRAFGPRRRRDGDVAAWIAQDPLYERLRPGRHAKRLERTQRVGDRWSPQELALCERAHDDDADP